MQVYSQLEVASLENLAADPSLLPAGRIWFNTVSEDIKVRIGAVSSKLLRADRPIIGAFANVGALPAAGNAGRLAYITDLGALYLDNGVSWDLASGGKFQKLANQSVSGAGTVTIGSGARLLKYVQGNAAPTIADSTTPITAGTIDGQELRLVGLHDDNTLTIQSSGNAKLNGEIVLAKDDVIDLMWNATDSLWIETARSK